MPFVYVGHTCVPAGPHCWIYDQSFRPGLLRLAFSLVQKSVSGLDDPHTMTPPLRLTNLYLCPDLFILFGRFIFIPAFLCHVYWCVKVIKSNWTLVLGPRDFSYFSHFIKNFRRQVIQVLWYSWLVAGR